MPAEARAHHARLEGVLLGGGILACTFVLLATLAAAGPALRAWLAAAALWTGIPIGGLCLLMMMRLIPGIWDDELMVHVEAATLLVPLAALAFIPVLLGAGILYAWVGESQGTPFRSTYLSWGFFSVRTVIWFGLLASGAYLLVFHRRWSTLVSCIGLIAFSLFGSAIAADWLMSLDPEFHSSGFGLYVLSIQTNVALLICSILALEGGAAMRRPQVIGGLMLASVLLWAYLAFMQYFIIWSGDLPQRVLWYQHRDRGAWSDIFWAVVLLHAVPAFLLLLTPVLRRAWLLRGLAALLLIGKAFELAWLVLPSAKNEGAGWSDALLTVLALGGLGAIFMAALIFALRRRVEARKPHGARVHHGAAP